ncbi:hypothetical protein BCR39DRAFT_536874 [Naematelia encephala]|uniref:Uncharacterized protein n=1 Tax=Naematelia encephala TaxID=71784 RepID=A0A1Y2AZS0_9TREE|nr:hypothetical protein BCR39DRAFT_536874 [Naematelia encephala]
MSGIRPRQSAADRQSAPSTSTRQQGAPSTSTESGPSRAPMSVLWQPTSTGMPDLSRADTAQAISSSIRPSRQGSEGATPLTTTKWRTWPDRGSSPMSSPQISTYRRTPPPSSTGRHTDTTGIGSLRTNPTRYRQGNTRSTRERTGRSAGTIPTGGTLGFDPYTLPLPDIASRSRFPTTHNWRGEHTDVWKRRCRLSQQLLWQFRRVCTQAGFLIPLGTSPALLNASRAFDGIVLSRPSEDGNSQISQRLPTGTLLAPALMTTLYASESVINKNQRYLDHAQSNGTPVSLYTRQDDYGSYCAPS